MRNDNHDKLTTYSEKLATARTLFERAFDEAQNSSEKESISRCRTIFEEFIAKTPQP